MTTTPEKLKPFEFHGLDINIESKTQAYADCHVCGGQGKLGIKIPTGQYRCNKCETTGNAITFINDLHKISLKQTKTKQYNALTKHRYISPKELRAWGVAQSHITGDWLIPAYNLEGKLANLHKCIWSDDKFRILGTPGCKLHLFHIPNSESKNHKIVIISEGPWNSMMIRERIQESGGLPIDGKRIALDKIQLYGIPGANNFREEWVKLLDGKHVYLLGDNDWPQTLKSGKILKPGWDGMNKTIKLLEESGRLPASLHRIRWGKNGYTKKLANGYDPRDLLHETSGIEGLRSLIKQTEHIELHLPSKKTKSKQEEDTNEEPPKLEPLECSSFNQLVKAFAAKNDEGFGLHIHQPWKDTFACMLATVISTELPDEQIWLRVIGPGSSGKTTLANCIATASEYTIMRSMFTGFHSGFVGGGKTKWKDSSLIPKINGKTFIVKDGDTLLTTPNRDRVLAELRDLYDGNTSSEYRNRKSVEYNDIRTTMLLCGTADLRSLNRSYLGDRFLDIEILGDENTDPYIKRAASNAYSNLAKHFSSKNGEDNDIHSDDKLRQLKRLTYGFILHLKENLHGSFPTMSEKTSQKLQAIGQFVSYMRARSKREKDELSYRPRTELATRLIGQLIKLAVCLSIVMGKRKIDDEIIRIVRKVAFDTASGFPLEFTQLLSKYKELSQSQIAITLGLASTTTNRVLQDMHEFNIIKRTEKPNRSGIGGRHLHLWTLSSEMIKLWRIIQ